MNRSEFDALTLPEQQVIARHTTDAKLQEHIFWKADTSCWPFLAANAMNLSPDVLRYCLSILVARFVEGDERLEVKGAFENLKRYAPRELFDEALLYAARDRRRQAYFDHLRAQGVSIHPNADVPADWVEPS